MSCPWSSLKKNNSKLPRCAVCYLHACTWVHELNAICSKPWAMTKYFGVCWRRDRAPLQECRVRMSLQNRKIDYMVKSETSQNDYHFFSHLWSTIEHEKEWFDIELFICIEYSASSHLSGISMRDNFNPFNQKTHWWIKVSIFFRSLFNLKFSAIFFSPRTENMLNNGERIYDLLYSCVCINFRWRFD